MNQDGPRRWDLELAGAEAGAPCPSVEEGWESGRLIPAPAPSLGRAKSLGEVVEGDLESSSVGGSTATVLPPWASNFDLVGLPIEARVYPSRETVPVEDREDVVAEATLRGRREGFESVVEAETTREAATIADHRIERAQEAESVRPGFGPCIGS